MTVAKYLSLCSTAVLMFVPDMLNMLNMLTFTFIAARLQQKTSSNTQLPADCHRSNTCLVCQWFKKISVKFQIISSHNGS